MAETYDSVLDRIGAFNGATETMSKGRAHEMRFSIRGRKDVWLRLARTDTNYRIEVAAGQANADGLTALGFAPQGDVYVREVSKAERSWDVASQLEDILQDVLDLGPGVVIVEETA